MTRKPSYKGTQAQPSFLILGIMEHAGIGKSVPPSTAAAAPLWHGWLHWAAAKLKGVFK